MKRRIFAIILALVTIMSLSSCGKAENRTFTINDPETVNGFLTILMHKEKLIEKYVPDNVNVEWNSIASSPELRDAIVSGSLDIGVSATLSVVTALQNDMPLVYIANTGTGPYWLYARDPSIQSLHDLTKSHKIAISGFGSTPHSAFLLAVQNDLGDASIFADSIITMTNSDATTALISGTTGVDAVVCGFPTVMALWNSDEVHLLRDLDDVTLEYGFGNVYITSKDFADKNKDLMDAFLNAYQEAIEMLSNDRDKCVEIMMQTYEGCTKEQANEVLDFFQKTFDVGMSAYDDLNAFYYENGILDEPAELFENIPKYEAAK